MRALIIGIAVFVLLLLGNGDALASSNCNQTFFVLAKTEGDRSLLIYKEKLDGGCYCATNLFMLFLDPDTVTVYSTNYCEDPEKEWNLPHFRDLMTELCIRPIMIDGRFVLNDSMSITLPRVDTTFMARFVADDIGMCVPSVWHRKCGTDCLDEPIMDFSANLVYFHVSGVYKNYTIRDVWYWEQSGYLLIQTENPIKAAGLDTMHGMLLYRVGIQKQEGK